MAPSTRTSVPGRHGRLQTAAAGHGPPMDSAWSARVTKVFTACGTAQGIMHAWSAARSVSMPPADRLPAGLWHTCR